MSVTNYIYDGNQYLAEADGTNTVNRVFTNEPDAYTHLISQEEVSSGDSLNYHYDAVGSTRQVTDDAETVTDELTYDAWGNRLSRSGTSDIPLQYVGETGYYYDVERQSYYVMNRNYIPSIARWSTVDPLWFIGLPAYMYCSNTPVNHTDESGLLSYSTNQIAPSGGRCLKVNPDILDWLLEQLNSTNFFVRADATRLLKKLFNRICPEQKCQFCRDNLEGNPPRIDPNRGRLEQWNRFKKVCGIYNDSFTHIMCCPDKPIDPWGVELVEDLADAAQKLIAEGVCLSKDLVENIKTRARANIGPNRKLMRACQPGVEMEVIVALTDFDGTTLFAIDNIAPTGNCCPLRAPNP